MPTAYIADRIFDGEHFLTGYAVITENGKVAEVVKSDTLPADVNQRLLPGCQLAPAFLDLQIYGGNGQLFSIDPSVSSLEATYQYCLQGGASHFMATVATNSPDIVYQAIAAVKNYWDQGQQGLLGLHLEGPYLNIEKKGAHLSQYIKQPTMQEVKELLSVGKGIIRMMTLAPECCDQDIIRYLVSEGVIVSAGHSDATYEQSMDGFASGITTATHLYNAMSPLQHRAPGLVGAVFNGDIFSSIIPDGIHVDFAAVSVAKKIMQDRLFIITDAVTNARTTSYTYIFQNDRYVTENNVLAGSCLTQAKGVKNLIDHVGIEPNEALKMASLIPAKVIGKDKEMGRIGPGYRADMVILSEQFEFKNIILEGKLQ